jgi:peptidoglycan/LPS O-acetylase OafA/YrhL
MLSTDSCFPEDAQDMRSEVSRMPAVDALKAIACVLIVLHHLAFYGPMADVAKPLMPTLINGLDIYARMAVQVFLVVSGFLFAAKVAPHGVASIKAPLNLMLQRYTRLVVPYSAALLLAVCCSAVAGVWMDHHSVSGAPSLLQLLSHVLLHDLVDQEALSAGVWYVAIDFQLFALAILLLWLPSRFAGRHPWVKAVAPLLIGAMTMASLFGFNRDDFWDESAFYFFGAFGLGIMAWWASGRQHATRWLGLLAVLVIAALAVDFRGRIAIAAGVMLFLGLARKNGFLNTLPVPAPLLALSRISYSVFLVHFPLCLLVNATVTTLFPANPVINALGMIVALAISIAGGALFYRRIESYPFPNRMRLLFPAGVVAGGWLTALAAANFGG